MILLRGGKIAFSLCACLIAMQSCNRVDESDSCAKLRQDIISHFDQALFDTSKNFVLITHYGCIACVEFTLDWLVENPTLVPIRNYQFFSTDPEVVQSLENQGYDCTLVTGMRLERLSLEVYNVTVLYASLERGDCIRVVDTHNLNKLPDIFSRVD